MRKIFVTGGKGFIGSNFIRLILDEMPDCEVVNFDSLSYTGNYDNTTGIRDPRYRFVYGDVTNNYDVDMAFREGFDAVVNFAAETDADRSLCYPEKFVRTNVIGTQVLLDAARKYNVSRFVQISTYKVLGSLSERNDSFFVENSPYAPNSPYAASKAAAEHLVRAAGMASRLDAIITRSGNNYGPRQSSQKFIPTMISNALNDLPIPIYGDGKNVRDWIYVEDHCRGILAALLKGKAGEVYNIGARNERRNLDVAVAILNILGKPYSLINFVSDRRGNDRQYAIDTTKAERQLDWNAFESWESGLVKTVNWYLENRQWIDRSRSNQSRRVISGALDQSAPASETDTQRYFQEPEKLAV